MAVRPDKLEDARALVARILSEIERIGEGDLLEIHHLRRYVWKRLEYHERGTPLHRRKLKALMLKSQNGLCFDCGQALGAEPELDRIAAHLGYKAENVRLVCHECHRSSQKQKKYT